jgi:tRNA-(ms[2]io[6]A)-hydroxylase
MKKRGYELSAQRKDDYVNLLLEHQKKGGSREDRLLDKLMICALIEARSCERFRLLSEQLEDDELKKFYYKFMVSEAGHYRLFIELAGEYFPPERVKSAWQQWLDNETAVLQRLSPRGDRMH